MVRLSVACATAAALLWLLSALPRPASEPAPARGASVAPEDVAYDKALFSAKGCATCHTHAAITRQHGPAIGPNLTTYTADPAYVRAWLRDPRALKPATRMPNLGLSEDEIAALLAFLNAGSAARR